MGEVGVCRRCGRHGEIGCSNVWGGHEIQEVSASFIECGCLLTVGGGADRPLAETMLQEIVVQEDGTMMNFVSPDRTVMDGQTLLTVPTNVTVIEPERFNLDTVNYTNTRYELMNRVQGMTNVRNLRVPCGWCDYTVNLQNGMATQPLEGGSFNFDHANNRHRTCGDHQGGGVGADFGFTIPNAQVFGQEIGRLGFRINASHYELDGWREWRAERKDTGSFRLAWDPGALTSLELGGTHAKRYDENPGEENELQGLEGQLGGGSRPLH